MATILVLGVKVPFTVGGQDVLVKSLVQQLKARGHDVDTLELPFSSLPKHSLLDQAALWRSLDLREFAGRKVDLVIATKFPSYFAKHPKKSTWLVHQHRAIYDLYGTRYSDISDDPRDEELRRLLMDADAKVIGESSYVSGISKNVINRLEKYNSIKGTVLYPPLSMGNQYQEGEFGNYMLYVGRICSIKRLDLLVKALPTVHNFVTLKIAGVADEPRESEYLKNEIDKHHLWDRVEFLGRVSDAELLKLYSNSLGVYYAPHNEDYGYVTLEAMASGKPVVTASDSGGVLEFVEHEKTGLIAEPNCEQIGKAVNRLVEDKAFAKSLGQEGRQRIEKLGVLESGWDHVIEGLLSPLNQEQKVCVGA